VPPFFDLFPSDLLVSRRSFLPLVLVSATLPVCWRVVQLGWNISRIWEPDPTVPILGGCPEFGSRIRELVTTLLYLSVLCPPTSLAVFLGILVYFRDISFYVVVIWW
jgi:hypothetical protein